MKPEGPGRSMCHDYGLAVSLAVKRESAKGGVCVSKEGTRRCLPSLAACRHSWAGFARLKIGRGHTFAGRALQTLPEDVNKERAPSFAACSAPQQRVLCAVGGVPTAT